MAKVIKTAKRIVIGGTLAAAAGYVAGVLTAPKSGKETRTRLRHSATEQMTAAEKELKKLHTDLGKTIDDTKSSSDDLSKKAQKELDGIVEKAKDTKEKVREVISAIHEGGAEDKDLQRAVKDATAAIAHLKDYLKK